ncbi:IgA FC receptor precursor [compost metagenome]
MQALHSISLSALLLAASLPAFAVTAGDAVEATPAPAAPAIQVVPAAQAAPLAPAVPAASEAAAPAPSVPAAPALPVTPAAPATAATAQEPIAPVAPMAPASQGAAAAQPAAVAPAAAAPAPIAPALPVGTAALGSLINPQTLALIDQLRALQVTPQQAMGGVGALLGLAQSQLAADQYAQLAGSVPGLELLAGNAGSAASAGNGVSGVLGRLGALSGLLGGTASPAPQPGSAPVDSLAGVGQAFSVLGMDTSLVGQFAPILLQFLAGQGLAGALLQSLGGIWGVPGGLAPTVPATPAGTPVAVGG